MKWGKAGKGKWFRRQLNKRRRRYTKLALTKGITHTRGLSTWESRVNWKGT
jgi:hypothetical protein